MCEKELRKYLQIILTIFFPLLSQLIIKQSLMKQSSDIANAFNNYFAKVAIDIQFSITFSKKKYDYIAPLNIESFFITPSDSTEVSNIISSTLSRQE